MLDDETLRLLSEGRILNVLGGELEPLSGRRMVDSAGRELDDFLSSAYLGISSDRDLIDVCHASLGRQGLYQYSSPVFRCSEAQNELRTMLARATGLPTVRFYSSVSLLHLDVLGAVAGRLPVYVDRLSHYSIFRALRGLGCRKYDHNDIDALRSAIHAYGPGLIVTDSVFSMSGEVVDIAMIGCLATAESCCVYLDDSHGVGVLDGRLVFAGESLVASGADVIYVGTFGKAMSCPLAFVCYNDDSDAGRKIERRGLSYVFSGQPSDMEFQVARLAVKNHLDGKYNDNLSRLNRYCRCIVASLEHLLPNDMRITTDGWGIVSIWFSDLSDFRKACISLWSAEIAFDVVGFPAINRGSFLARFCVSAAHRQEQIDRLCSALSNFVLMV